MAIQDPNTPPVPPAAPDVPKVKPLAQGTNPPPLALPTAGQSSTGQIAPTTPTQPLQAAGGTAAADPLAFAPLTNPQPPTPNTATVTPSAASPATTPAAPSSPLAGRTADEIYLYWLGQNKGGAGLSGAGTSFQGQVSGTAANPTNATQQADASQAIYNANKDKIDTLTAGVQKSAADQRAAEDAATRATNAQAGAADAAAWAKALPGYDYTGASAPNKQQITGDPNGELNAETPEQLLVAGKITQANYDRLKERTNDPAAQAEIVAQNMGLAPSGSGIQPPTGPASDVGGAVPPTGSTATTTPGSGSGAGSGGSVTPSSGAAYNTAPIDPNNALLGQVITPDAGLDRFKIANDQWQNYVKSTEPAFQADARDIAAQSFGAGRGVSGMNRTREGNLALARERDLNARGSDFLNNALTGSIEDAKYKTGVAQQQQQYQAGRADTAFNQEDELARLNEALTSGAFGRALQQETAGYANSPDAVARWISENYARQAGDAGNAAAGSFANAGRSSGSGDSYQQFLDFLKRYQQSQQGGGGGGTGNQEYIPE